MTIVSCLNVPLRQLIERLLLAQSAECGGECGRRGRRRERNGQVVVVDQGCVVVKQVALVHQRVDREEVEVVLRIHEDVIVVVLDVLPSVLVGFIATVGLGPGA